MFANCCSDTVKAALILGGAIIVAATIVVSATIYFSPFQSCVREMTNQNGFPFVACVQLLSGG